VSVRRTQRPTAASPADTIAFDIPAGDANCDATPHVCTIALSSQLPDITEAIVIDGYTEPGASATSLDVGDNAAALIRIDAGGDFGSDVAGGLIGGTDAGEGNVIAYSGADGVVVAQNSLRWTMLGNSICYNGYGRHDESERRHL
jgi:hypothetical protein